MNNNFYVFLQDSVYQKGFFGTICEVDLSINNDDYNLLHVVWKEVIRDQCYLQHGFDVDAGDVVVDVGANIGLFSRYALTRGASIVHAIEPHPTAFNCLALNNSKSVNFHPYKFGLSDENKFINMHVGGYNKEYYFMADTLTEKTDNNYSYTIPAQLMTMDTLYMSGVLSKIDFLKVDIEGAEVSLFEGFSDENLKSVDKIAIEIHPMFTSGIPELKERLLSFFDIVYSDEQMYGDLSIIAYRRKRDVG